MLPFIIGGLVVGTVAWAISEASSENNRARREYKDTYNKSVARVKKRYFTSKQIDTLDKLYKVKKAKLKIADSIYKELKGYKKEYKKINLAIKATKDTLKELSNKKKMAVDRYSKQMLEQEIYIVKSSRRELFNIRDSLKSQINEYKERLDIANQEVKYISDNIRLIKDGVYEDCRMLS